MGQEIDLLENYPRTKRNVEERGATKTEDVRRVARQFGKEFFDGDRQYGYGGFKYFPRFWQPVIPTLQKHFGLTGRSSLLDVGCAKGFMLHDLVELIPDITVSGVDVSDYAIAHAMDDIKSKVQVADARDLPFADNSFDVAIAINTIHNLDRDDCAQALREIERVSRKGSFITVDAYRNDDEKERMFAWNLTAKTIMSVDDWVSFFEEVGYTGDYFWFVP
ncbi:MAG: class I SAM-dependent methyltransferase [Planktomarina sp.]|nr:class I SAM-dependent methyltransferase [Planktomarina sp.]